MKYVRQKVNIPTAKKRDSGVVETNIPNTVTALMGLAAINKKFDQCQTQSRFMGR